MSADQLPDGDAGRLADAETLIIQLSGGPLDGRLVELKLSVLPELYRVPRRFAAAGPWGGWLYRRTEERTPLGLPVYLYVDGG